MTDDPFDQIEKRAASAARNIPDPQPDTKPRNAFEVAARQRKVSKMVEFLVSAKITAEDAEGASEKEWQWAAKGAMVTVPSAETRRQVIAALRAREGRIDRATGMEMGPELMDVPDVNWDDITL